MTDTQTRTDVVDHEIGATGELVLRTHSTDIDIRAVDGGTVRVRDADGHDLAEQFRIDREPNRLVMRPRDKVMLDLGFIRRGRGGGRLQVELPPRASLAVDTASGDVHATGLIGEQRYRTASGRIELRGIAGIVAIDAVSGSTEVSAAGDLELSGRTVSGHLRLDGATLRSGVLSTTSGSVSLLAPLVGPGPYSLQTVSGHARVVAGPNGLRVISKTLTGQISTDGERASKAERRNGSIVVGNGAIELGFQSISGNLRISTSIDPGSGETTSQASPEPPARSPEPDAPPEGGTGEASDTDHETRLRILRDLESGAIDVELAARRLAAIEDAPDV